MFVTQRKKGKKIKDWDKYCQIIFKKKCFAPTIFTSLCKFLQYYFTVFHPETLLLWWVFLVLTAVQGFFPSTVNPAARLRHQRSLFLLIQSPSISLPQSPATSAAGFISSLDLPFFPFPLISASLLPSMSHLAIPSLFHYRWHTGTCVLVCFCGAPARTTQNSCLISSRG